MDAPSSRPQLEIALAAFPADRLDEATALYNQVLAHDPDYAGARHMLGVIALHTGQTDVAIDRFRAAIARKPDFASAHCNLGSALMKLGAIDDATLDSLWMGVPVVSLTGNTAVARGGLSILSTLGLPELATYSDAAFIQTAITLAADAARLSDLRASLRARLQHSPLTDATRFARNIESAYRALWRHRCTSPT